MIVGCVLFTSATSVCESLWYNYIPVNSAGSAHYACTLFGLAGIPLILLSVIIQKVLAPSTIYNYHINSYGLMEAANTCPWQVKYLLIIIYQIAVGLKLKNKYFSIIIIIF